MLIDSYLGPPSPFFFSSYRGPGNWFEMGVCANLCDSQELLHTIGVVVRGKVGMVRQEVRALVFDGSSMHICVHEYACAYFYVGVFVGRFVFLLCSGELYQFGGVRA